MLIEERCGIGGVSCRSQIGEVRQAGQVDVVRLPCVLLRLPWQEEGGGEVVDPTEEPAYKLFVKDRLILQANELLTSIRLRSLHRILREPGIGGGGT